MIKRLKEKEPLRDLFNPSKRKPEKEKSIKELSLKIKRKDADLRLLKIELKALKRRLKKQQKYYTFETRMLNLMCLILGLIIGMLIRSLI